MRSIRRTLYQDSDTIIWRVNDMFYFTTTRQMALEASLHPDDGSSTVTITLAASNAEERATSNEPTEARSTNRR